MASTVPSREVVTDIYKDYEEDEVQKGCSTAVYIAWIKGAALAADGGSDG